MLVLLEVDNYIINDHRVIDFYKTATCINGEGYSNLQTMRVQDEGYSNLQTMRVHDEGYSSLQTMRVHDEGAVMTTFLPVLFKYCYKYCYSDSRKL